MPVFFLQKTGGRATRRPTVQGPVPAAVQGAAEAGRCNLQMNFATDALQIAQSIIYDSIYGCEQSKTPMQQCGGRRLDLMFAE